MSTGKSGAVAAMLTTSHLLTPTQFAHVWVSRHAQVLDVRASSRAATHPAKHVARAGLVAAARTLVARGKIVLVIDHADQARGDTRRLRRAGIRPTFVLGGGVRAYRAAMRFGSY